MIDSTSHSDRKFKVEIRSLYETLSEVKKRQQTRDARISLENEIAMSDMTSTSVPQSHSTNGTAITTKSKDAMDVVSLLRPVSYFMRKDGDTQESKRLR